MTLERTLVPLKLLSKVFGPLFLERHFWYSALFAYRKILPTFTKKPTETLEDTEGDAVGASATFECEVSPSTAVTTWMKDDSNLRESPKHKFTSDGKDRRLAIIDVQLSDTGEYTCVAKLGNKEKTTTAKLIVEVEQGERSDLDEEW
uniref:Ig-like domain-containing protein n=1 Tax=Oncorhynchus mykiss TaxID=8022 RepID=A0A8K9Y2E7_ONCMY